MIYPWGDSRRFNSYAGYFRRTFGSRVQKLSVDAGFGCPNRDGTISTGGVRSATTERSPPPTAPRRRASGSRSRRGSSSTAGATARPGATWSTSRPTRTPMHRLRGCGSCMPRRWRTRLSRGSSSARAPTASTRRSSTTWPAWPATATWPSSTASSRPPTRRCAP